MRVTSTRATSLAAHRWCTAFLVIAWNAQRCWSKLTVTSTRKISVVAQHCTGQRTRYAWVKHDSYYICTHMEVQLNSCTRRYNGVLSSSSNEDSSQWCMTAIKRFHILDDAYVLPVSGQLPVFETTAKQGCQLEGEGQWGPNCYAFINTSQIK